jgi:hypothetical protein
MSRAQKQYERLDSAEAIYSSLLRAELEAVLRGGLGHYLGRRLRVDWHRVVRSSADDRAIDLESLEKEIRGLRSKLREPVPGAAIDVAEALVQRFKDAGEWMPGANKAWVRGALAKIPQQDQATQETEAGS